MSGNVIKAEEVKDKENLEVSSKNIERWKENVNEPCAIGETRESVKLVVEVPQKRKINLQDKEFLKTLFEKFKKVMRIFLNKNQVLNFHSFLRIKIL